PEEPTVPEEENDALTITDVSLPFQVDVSKGMEFSITGRGFATGDGLIFQPTTGSSEGRVTVDTAKVTDNSAVVVLPEGLSSVRYEIYVSRGAETFLLGATTLNFVFNA